MTGVAKVSQLLATIAGGIVTAPADLYVRSARPQILEYDFHRTHIEAIHSRKWEDYSDSVPIRGDGQDILARVA
jgi:hypothetical protein